MDIRIKLCKETWPDYHITEDGENIQFVKDLKDPDRNHSFPCQLEKSWVIWKQRVEKILGGIKCDICYEKDTINLICAECAGMVCFECVFKMFITRAEPGQADMMLDKLKAKVEISDELKTVDCVKIIEGIALFDIENGVIPVPCPYCRQSMSVE